MQLLGKVMMALSIAFVGVAIGMGTTGVGIIPAIVVGILSAGLFAAGALLVRKELKEEKNFWSGLHLSPSALLKSKVAI